MRPVRGTGLDSRRRELARPRAPPAAPRQASRRQPARSRRHAGRGSRPRSPESPPRRPCGADSTRAAKEDASPEKSSRAPVSSTMAPPFASPRIGDCARPCLQIQFGIRSGFVRRAGRPRPGDPPLGGSRALQSQRNLKTRSGSVSDSFGVAVRLQFGNCTLDSDTRELWRGKKAVHVEPKAYRLLELLLAARPRALSKDDLQDALWPGTFVSERSLARLVGVLRDCLGDDAGTAPLHPDRPRFRVRLSSAK